MTDLKNQIKEKAEAFEKDLKKAKNAQDLDEIYLEYFSKKSGQVTKLVEKLPDLDVAKKREIGPQINTLQNQLKEDIEKIKKTIETKLKTDPFIDLTLPKPAKKAGYLHPTNQVIREMNKFFRYYGYSIAEGPEIETVEYNFKKLNLPEGHPATDLQDTLFIKADDIMLRTHTSSVEARVLTDYKPPIRVVTPGKVYRNETVNRTNASFFHHYQGVVVDKGITIQNLKATLDMFHRFLFGEDVVLRFRYKYYPEVSPGMGVDMRCNFCEGAGCAVCKHRGWIESLGSGMIHYNTLKMCNIDPEKYTGFAFGMGLDRLVMQKFGLSDIRKLYGGGMVYV